MECVEGRCSECPKLTETYTTLLGQEGHTKLKYTQWEKTRTTYINSKGKKVEAKVWKQIDHWDTLANIIRELDDGILEMKRHMFTNDFQYFQHQHLIKNLPLDQAVAYGDFAQNYLLAPNDEIESAHYCTPQVTLHTWYLVRHSESSTLESPQLTKESIVMVSDDLKHDTNAVYNFTKSCLPT